MYGSSMHWIAKKILFATITWFLAISISIIVIVLSPGDPAKMLLASFLQQGMPYEQAVRMVQAYLGFSPEEPWWSKWLRYFQGVVTGNLGTSISYRFSVTHVIANAIPWSAFFVSYSLSITLILGVLMGLTMTYYRERVLFVRSISSILTILNSVPNWILAAVFFVYLGVRWRLFPYSGPYSPDIQPEPSLQFILSVLHHYTLPVMVMVLASLPGWAFALSAMASAVIKEDYVIAAKARGLKSGRIITAYIAKNSILPIYANIALTFAWLLVGTVWIETQFNLPGLGSLLSVTTGARDYPVMIGVYVIIITVIVLGNLLTDITYGLIDPRARVGEA
ncbi:MAG: ABC transporter permease [Ignisphaera sp.]|uniref:ABC transporter permease n=1 Tax=Ignisphaera aggregans TaxID=334771 RepID=A0A7J3I6Q1_9CREN